MTATTTTSANQEVTSASSEAACGAGSGSAASGLVELVYGPVFYEHSPPAADSTPTGRTALLVHGFSGTHRVFDHNVPALCAAGHSVVRLDLYGRGQSAKPRVAYDMSLFCGQLRELLAALAIDGPVDLVAQSMGGAIAIGFTDLYPDAVGRVVLMAPAGLRRPIPFTARLARWGVFGPKFATLVGPKVLRAGMRRAFNEPSRVRAFLTHAYLQAGDPDFFYAQARSLRDMPLFDFEDAYRRVARKGRKLAVIWGTRDKIAPFSIAKRARAVLPRAEFHALEGASHVCCYEEPERVNPLLVDFLR